MQYGELYHTNYYREVKDKKSVYYEFYHLDGTEEVPDDYKEISFVCLRPLDKRSSTKGCAGTVRTLRCQYHHECLCPLYKESQAGIRKVA